MDFKTLHSSYYFSLGCCYAFTEYSNETFKLKVSFIELNASSLEHFFSYDWSIYDRETVVIIICDGHLLPLACYFQRIYMSIIAVFTSKESIKKISQFIHEYNEKKEKRLTTIEPISHCEYKTLINAIKGVSVHSEARNLNRSVKTIYTHRLSVAHKLGARRLSKVFISGSK